MKYSELQATLQNLTNTNIAITEIAKVLNVTKQNMHFRVKSAKGNIPKEEIELLENAFNVTIPEDEIEADYYYDVFGSCGAGSFVLSENKTKITFSRELITDYSKLKRYSVINAIGSSMEPFLHDKDKLIVEHCEADEQIKDNKIYVFCYENCIYVKRLIKNIDEIVVKSDNPDPMYRARFIQKEDMNNLHLIGQVVGVFKDVR